MLQPVRAQKKGEATVALPIWIWVHRVMVIAPLTALTLLWICYWGRFDWCVAITVYPPWICFLVGVIATGPCMVCRPRLWGVGVMVLWTVFLAVFSDSPRSLLQRGTVPDKISGTMRVVSLNCAGDARVVDEIDGLDPDIVLLQESPAAGRVREIADRIFGDDGRVFWHSDTSIIARGELTRIKIPSSLRANFVHARVRIESMEVDVISLHLLPCPVRCDLWSGHCWSEYRTNRQQRRIQMEKIAKHIDSIPRTRNLICGGDFNAPPGDAIFRLLEPRLYDPFLKAGRGWGKTFHNEWPVLRIDQIWVGHPFRPLAVSAKKTQYSDHRMVVCDLEP